MGWDELRVVWPLHGADVSHLARFRWRAVLAESGEGLPRSDASFWRGVGSRGRCGDRRRDPPALAYDSGSTVQKVGWSPIPRTKQSAAASPEARSRRAAADPRACTSTALAAASSAAVGRTGLGRRPACSGTEARRAGSRRGQRSRYPRRDPRGSPSTHRLRRVGLHAPRHADRRAHLRAVPGARAGRHASCGSMHEPFDGSGYPDGLAGRRSHRRAHPARGTRSTR